MKQLRLLIFLLFFSAELFAQKPIKNRKPAIVQKMPVNIFESIDRKALQLPESLTISTEGIAQYIIANFNTDKEKTRAIFVWVATNIQYDVDNMFAMNFYEKKEDKISKPLKTRKGICENYAALFDDICSKSGIKSFIIEGYTKQNGFTDYIPHAWCAAMVDSSWYLFDPTWGSGYINGGKFFRKINNDFYMASPAVLIKSHIPFDYMWQFLNYPITNQEFYEGSIQENKSKPYFSYVDSIKAYENKNNIEQKISAAYRIEKNGVKNSMIFDRLQHIKLEIENDRQNKIMNLYNSAVADYNEGINDFNEFIDFRNRQFTPQKADPEILNMLDAPDNKFRAAKIELSQIKNPDRNLANMILQLTRTIDDATAHLTEQQDWLKLYISKGKATRKSMFYERRVSIFGIPLK
jgi:hypothetical protein